MKLIIKGGLYHGMEVPWSTLHPDIAHRAFDLGEHGVVSISRSRISVPWEVGSYDCDLPLGHSRVKFCYNLKDAFLWVRQYMNDLIN